LFRFLGTFHSFDPVGFAIFAISELGFPNHWLEGIYEQLDSALNDVIRRRVAVIAIPGSTPVSLAAKAATTAIPSLT
jgi:hypothetical protein